MEHQSAINAVTRWFFALMAIGFYTDTKSWHNFRGIIRSLEQCSAYTRSIAERSSVILGSPPMFR